MIALIALIPLSDLHQNADFQAMALVPWVAASEAHTLAARWRLAGRRRSRPSDTPASEGRVDDARDGVRGHDLCVAASLSNRSHDALEGGFGGSNAQRTWIDDAVGRDANVVTLW